VTGAVVAVGLGNLVLAGLLAALAYVVHRTGRYPSVAHLLWVLVLVKAVTPPVVLLPVIPGPATTPVMGSLGVVVSSVERSGGMAADPAVALVLAWVAGSAAVLVGSIVRIRRFDRLLRRTSTPAPLMVLAIATDLARTLGLRSVPAVELSSARVSPMTWWVGRRVRVVLPTALVAGIDPDQLRLILAHELAHVRRHDHLVRWLEWCARVVAWWNPIVWWAPRKLREAEELSCDALVLDRLGARPRSYAGALLAVVEFLASPAARQPAFVTGMGAGTTLERRFHEIVSQARRRSAPRWLRAAVSVAAFASLLLGIGSSGSAELAIPPAATMSPAGTAGTDGPGDQGYSFVSTAIAPPAQGMPTSRAWGERRVGGRGADELAGGRGDDRIDGRGGADDLAGGRGDDLIRGGPGRDSIDAGPGDDVVVTWQDGRRDDVDCGAGAGDRAIADQIDVVVDCEVIDRREPLT
jgi:beta-lactamase regulating signal transducer with metallopeptidase domain